MKLGFRVEDFRFEVQSRVSVTISFTGDFSRRG